VVKKKEVILGNIYGNNFFNVTEDTLYKVRVNLRSGKSLKCNLVFSHSAPGLSSFVDLRFVLWGGSMLDVKVLMKVSTGLVQTDSYLSVKVLTLGEGNLVKVVPSVEVSEKELKCGHGATVSCLDKAMVNYLRSRGLSFDQAVKLLVKCFLN